MKATGKKMVVILNVDTGDFDSVLEVEAKPEMIRDSLSKAIGKKVVKAIKPERWPKEGGMRIGKLVKHIPCGILVYDDSPEDCLIIHRADCWYYRVGC